MTRRFRCLCRSTAQAGRVSPRPKWAQDLPWLADQAPAAASGHEGPAPASGHVDDALRAGNIDVKEFYYGWGREVMKAWRRFDARSPTELAEKMQEPPNAMETDPVEAVFAGGHIYTVTDITVVEWRRLLLGRRSGGRIWLWEGEHVASHRKLTIATKPDRGKIMVIEEQGRQICQVRVAQFQLGRPITEADAMEQWFEFLKALAEEYAKGNIVKSKIYEKRNELLAHFGLPRVVKRKLEKKPATVEKEKEKEKEKDSSEDHASEQEANEKETENSENNANEEEHASENHASEEEEKEEPKTNKKLKKEGKKQSQPRLISADEDFQLPVDADQPLMQQWRTFSAKETPASGAAASWLITEPEAI